MVETRVKSHPRVGTKRVKSHLRRIQKDYERTVNPVREKLEIVELDDISVIEIPSEIFNQIKAGVVTPIEGLKCIGFNDLHLQELFDFNGISDKGEAVLRNGTNGALQKVQLMDFSSPRSPPSIQI